LFLPVLTFLYIEAFSPEVVLQQHGRVVLSEMWFLKLLYWVSSCGQPIRRDSPAWVLGEGINSHIKKKNSLFQNVTQVFRIVGSCEHVNEPSGRVTISFSGRTLFHGVI